MNRCPKCITGRIIADRELGQQIRFSCLNCGYDGGTMPDMTPTPKLYCPDCGKEQTRGIAGLTVHARQQHGDVVRPTPRTKAMAITPREIRI